MGKEPLAVLATKDSVDDVAGGHIELVDGHIAQASFARVFFSNGVVLTDGKWDLRDGDVFFNVGNATVKVGDILLQRGECALFTKKRFGRLNINVATDGASKPVTKEAATVEPAPQTRYKITINKIDPGVEQGVVLKDSRGNGLRIGGPVSEVMFPGDCTLEVKVKGATISTLIFGEPCVLTLAKDKTLLADRENIGAKDARGKLWTSRKVTLGGKEVYVFIPQ